MSAIDTTFHWVRNPTAINGLQTTYGSKRGSDVSGDGTAQNPYASIAKATSVATADTNMMLDEAIWSEQRTLNGRSFKWWGNGRTWIKGASISMTSYNYDRFNFLKITNIRTFNSWFNYCYVSDSTSDWQSKRYCNNCILINFGFFGSISPYVEDFSNNIVINAINAYDTVVAASSKFVNNIFIGVLPNFNYNSSTGIIDYNNYTTLAIPTTNGANAHSINNASTGQTVSDYFNNYDLGDYTAKVGSANIGAGEKGTMIGFNQGYTMYADNSANSVFKISNGAELRNVQYDSNLRGYVLVQKERVVQGATANKITLDSSASPVDDYYNNLFIGIVVGDGYGELFLITDYDGATKTATIDGTWATTPTTNSIYTISGTILSAIKDLGKAIKVKRNWTFADNFTALQDGQWAEFMTHVGTNGKQFPVSCYSYEYSTDGVNFIQGQTADDLVSAINGDNKVTDNIYGDCSANYDVATAKNLILRYIRVRIHIGFNIGE